jgi:mannose/fructose/N-acetylgalactosamine-specific phosphotransferase system component IIC
MAKEKNIKDELLKQIEHAPDTNAAAKILARDTARVKRMKWLTIITWSFVAACFVGGGVLEHAHRAGVVLEEELFLMAFMMALARILSLFAVVFTISLYVRSRTLTIGQIQVRLAAIEEQLRRMAQDKSPRQDIDGSA